MGALISYWKMGGGHVFDEGERQEGGQRLGELLRAAVIGDHPRNEILDVLQGVIADANFALRYEFLDDMGNPANHQAGAASDRGQDKIVIQLISDGLDPQLILTVRSDRREDNNGRKYHMDVILPEKDEINAFSYLKGVAKDTTVIVNDPTDPDKLELGADYLTAFKLLSRCD